MSFDSFPRIPTTERNPVVPVSVEMALELYRKNSVDSMINMSSFRDLYGSAVDQDKERATKLLSQFEAGYSPVERVNKRFAEAFEAVISDHIELSNWMGDNTTTIRASSFDDIVNGVDLILEINPDLGQENPAHVALGVDVTFGSDGTLFEKFERLKRKIRTGDFPKVKYFQSGDFRGEKSDLPEIILGVSKELIGELAALYAKNDGPAKKQLSVHPVQNLLAAQVLAQLDYFATFARNVGQEQFSRKIQRLRALLSPSLHPKAQRGSNEYGNDPVHQAIMAHAVV